MFEPFQQFVAKAANRYGVMREVKAAQVCQSFRSIIPQIFEGKESPETYIQPAFFKQNVLVINVENNGWAQEVIMRKTKIIEEMNRLAGEEVIKNLRTQLRQD